MQKKYLIILSTVVLSLCGAASLVYIRQSQLQDIIRNIKCLQDYPTRMPIIITRRKQRSLRLFFSARKRLRVCWHIIIARNFLRTEFGNMI